MKVSTSFPRRQKILRGNNAMKALEGDEYLGGIPYQTSQCEHTTQQKIKNS